MIDCLLPRICVKCGAVSFDEAACTCPTETTSGDEDVVIAALLEDALPVELAARNLRDVARAEGVDSVRLQLRELVSALEKDVESACRKTAAHRHVTADYIRAAVANHMTKIAILSGGLQA